MFASNCIVNVCAQLIELKKKVTSAICWYFWSVTVGRSEREVGPVRPRILDTANGGGQ